MCYSQPYRSMGQLMHKIKGKLFYVVLTTSWNKSALARTHTAIKDQSQYTRRG